MDTRKDTDWRRVVQRHRLHEHGMQQICKGILPVNACVGGSDLLAGAIFLSGPMYIWRISHPVAQSHDIGKKKRMVRRAWREWEAPTR